MAVLLDPPMWPAHGTLWSHLVSDSSLGELHAFAVAADIPARGFERDHYDVPAARHADLVALGAAPVPAHDLVRRLRASGLRRTPADRAGERSDLLARWADVLDGEARLVPAGSDLLARWGERGRLHHDVRHLREVLDAVDLLADAEGASRRDRRLALLAAWFHDAVHSSGLRRDEPAPAGGEEEASARLAVGNLGATAEGEEVARLVRLTADHRVAAHDTAGALLSDADLAVLGSSPARYADYAAAIRAEYAHVPAAVFRPARATILEELLAGPLFHTAAARERWEPRARENLAAEIQALRR